MVRGRAIFIGDPDHHRCVVGNCTETRLALLNGLQRPSAIVSESAAPAVDGVAGAMRSDIQHRCHDDLFFRGAFAQFGTTPLRLKMPYAFRPPR